MKKSEIVRILIYNAIFAGLGIFLIRTFVSTQFNSLNLLLLLFGLVVFDAIIENKKLSHYGIAVPKKSDLRLAVIIFSIFFPIAIATRILFPSFDSMYSGALGLNYSTLFQFILFTVPIAVLTEEIGIRALFQSKVTSAFSSRFAIYTTLINFTLLHFSWIYSVNFTNFAIIITTVFLYSIFLVLLFDYTKNIFATIIVHLLNNFVSSLQIFYHITSNFNYEIILWAGWGILFILLSPYAFIFLKKSFAISKGKIKSGYEKIIFAILSLFSLLTILLFNAFG